MSKREAIARYSVIINKLRKCPATFAEILNTLEVESELQGYNFVVSKRTFQRDVEDIRSLYNIDITFDFSERVYFIDYDEQTEANRRMLESFDVFNALDITERLSDYIHFETRRPQGTENLHSLLHAVKNNNVIAFNYCKYWDGESSIRTIEPYGLKEFKNRWYVIGNDLKDDIVKSFALDRLTELEVTKEVFGINGNFNINARYQNSFGIMSPNQDLPETVLLSVSPVQGKYLKSMPLHATQSVVSESEYETVLSLEIYITYDFIMELLSMGSNLKVLQPQSLIDQLKEIYSNALKQY